MLMSILHAFRRRLRGRQTTLELSLLDDHQLHDIGVDRSQIMAASHGIVERPTRITDAEARR